MKPDEYERAFGPLTLDYHATAWGDLAPHFDTLTRLATNAKTALEFGVRGAVSSWAILDGLPPDGTLTSVDLELDLDIVPRRVRDDPRWRPVAGDSRTVELPDADFVFIDTDHTYETTKAELARVRSAQVIALHDWYEAGVQQAIEEFADGWLVNIQDSKWGMAVLVRR